MTTVPYSQELEAILEHAKDLAQGTGRRLSSAHILLSLFTHPNQAQHFLREYDIDEDALLEKLSRIDNDPVGLLDEILLRAETVGRNSRSTSVTSLHLLTALSGFNDSAAYGLMVQTGVDIARMRTTAMGYLLNDNLPTRFKVKPGGKPRPQADKSGQRGNTSRPRASFGFHPGLERTAKQLKTGTRAPETKTTPPPAKPSKTRPTVDLAQRLFGQPKKKPAKAAPKVNLKVRAKPKKAVPIAPKRKPVERDPGAEFELSAKEFPTLTRFGRNLSAEAARGKIDPVVGRDVEIRRLTDILNKRRSNNPVLVGPAGVGKTAVVEGLAQLVVDAKPGGIEDRVIIEVEAGRIFGGTHLRGSLAERLVALKDEVEAAKGRIIVFLDEIHRWIGGASQDQGPDGVEELKPALARGTFPCIGATTEKEYSQSFENDSAFTRRFQIVRIEEPGIEETIRILEGVRSEYGEHHQVEFTDTALSAAARLSHRYILDRRNPDKALAVLDLCGSRARRKEYKEVDEALVAEVVAEMSGLPASKLLMSDRERFLRMEDHLMGAIVGHERNLSRIAHVLRRNYAGFVSGRPIGSFLFLGPTGVGKTETGKALADFLFHDRDAVTSIDMSEFGEAQSVARLIGSPPGYVGHESGGQLTETIRRRPYQIVLLDEIEKSNQAVQNLLLQVLDEARLTDSRGRVADFTNSVVILTSNLGSKDATSPKTSVGFGRSDEDSGGRAENVKETARRLIEPELWNRIDEVLVFEPLTSEQIERIAHLKLHESSRRLLDEKGIAYACSPAVVDFLIEHGGFDPELGARPLRRALERYVEGPIAELILEGAVNAPAEIQVDVEDGELVFEVT